MSNLEEEDTAIKPANHYPLIFTLVDHPYIEAIEIPKDNYLKIKIAGEWTKIYLSWLD